MRDEFEKYVESQKSEFDVHSIDESDKLRLWSNIVTEVAKPEPKVIPLWKKPAFKVAASIILLLGITLFFANPIDSANESSFANQELNDIDNHYKLLVNNQIELIKNNNYLSEKDRADFLTLIDDLDSEYETLKKELKLGINNQKIIEAIINNYRKKIKLMEDLLNRSYPPTNNTLDDEAIIL
ncbi:hypothetical protein [Seonamhaeicola marinus]|uniref:Anti-sigma factor n=1 Tax=Seonamhaeicola marinus TaxID=1912246 RepID=A0A5D0HSS8_9FLAO|nr:hypothetical protein [Seonamhaeicola marinus]TYA74161.1 hypothetical protein FUA24_12540 [Seonamhaeicola marinus]